MADSEQSVKKLDVDCEALRDRARKGEQLPQQSPPAANAHARALSVATAGTRGALLPAPELTAEGQLARYARPEFSPADATVSPTNRARS